MIHRTKHALGNIMTIDMEDWYHCIDQDPRNWSQYEDRIVDPIRRLLEIFDRTDTRATFFVLGDVAEKITGGHPLARKAVVSRHSKASYVGRQLGGHKLRDIGRAVSLEKYFVSRYRLLEDEEQSSARY